MPAVRPCAAFGPISPDLDLAALVESTPNFDYVTRIHCDMIDQQGLVAFEKLVLLHVVLGGKPLIVEGYQERLDRWTFADQWLMDNCSSKGEGMLATIDPKMIADEIIRPSGKSKRSH
jgi:hypothetical protein